MPSFRYDNHCHLIMEVNKKTGKIVRVFLDHYDPAQITSTVGETQEISVAMTNGISDDSARNAMLMELENVRHRWLFDYMDEKLVASAMNRWKVMNEFRGRLR